METIAPQKRPRPATKGSIAEDRLEGALAIGEFIDPKMTLREIRRRLETGQYPVWKEGRLYVASKAALLAHWQQKANAALTAPLAGERPPQNRSDARGYLGRRGGKVRRRADGGRA